MAFGCSTKVAGDGGDHILLSLRLPEGPPACLPEGSPAGRAEASQAGASLSPHPRWQWAQGNQESEVGLGFVARSPAWPGIKRCLNFPHSGGATNRLDERG